MKSKKKTQLFLVFLQQNILIKIFKIHSTNCSLSFENQTKMFDNIV